MKILDLFCGAGGAAMGYHKALEDAGIDHEIIGVDINSMPRYPFEFIQADAIEYCRDHGAKYDFIHASPPCQRYSMAARLKRNSHTKPDLLPPTRKQLQKLAIPWVIENVEGAPMKPNIILCGSFFNLGMIRHRWFETSFDIPLTLFPPCNHKGMYDPWHYGNNQRVEMAVGMGIDWPMKREEVREAIPPAYTKFIMQSYLMKEEWQL